MYFKCNSIYEINPMLRRIYDMSESDKDLYIIGQYDQETDDAQVLCDRFSEKWQQIQNCTDEAVKRKLLCDFLKLESVFEFFKELDERGIEIFLWNVSLLFNDRIQKTNCTDRDEIYASYVSFIDNVYNGKFAAEFEKTLLNGCDGNCETAVWLLPNGWLKCNCYIVNEDYSDICRSRFYDRNLEYVGEIERSITKVVYFCDFAETEAFAKYMAAQPEYDSTLTEDKDLLEIEEKIQSGELSENDLPDSTLSRLNVLYDTQIKDLSDTIRETSKKLRCHVFEMLVEIISKFFGIKESDIHLYSSLRKDLRKERNGELIDVEKLFTVVEQGFNIEITDEERESIYIVEDLREVVFNKFGN